MSATHNSVRARVNAYLRERRRAGCALTVIGSQLLSFARFAEERDHRGPLTCALALAWAQQSRRATDKTAAGRLAQLRPFAKFCHRLDPRNEIPPAQFFGPAYRQRIPHLYSLQEIRSLLAAAACWPPRGCLRADSYATLFGLLAATGLRLSEALGLKCRDVDFTHDLLHIRDGKFHKARYVPLHSSTTSALRHYAMRRDRRIPDPFTPKFFLSDEGRPLSLRTVQSVFERLRERLGWLRGNGRPAPRIHDLRFTFVCRRLERWYAKDFDIDRMILSLCTYVGHVNVTSTYWYLRATPELMRLAAQRFHRAVVGGVP